VSGVYELSEVELLTIFGYKWAALVSLGSGGEVEAIEASTLGGKDT
jgi:hypothetical protein